MTLRILLPFRVFMEQSGVARIVAETRDGAFGLLPRRRDCVAPLAPGILVFATDTGGDAYVAVDEGILVKTGTEVSVSVRNAIGGTDLDQLHAAVRQQFLDLDEQQKSVRAVLARLESGFVRRFAGFHRE